MRIGIDLGGTKIEGVALADDGTELARRRVATPAGDYRGTIEVIGSVIEYLESATGEAGSIGIGTPGAISPATGLMKNANSVILNGEALHTDLEDALSRPLRLANDADCMALSEATDGAGAGASPVFAVILGTGVGGGIVVDGKVVTGPNAIGGEWGHNQLPYIGEADLPIPACYCGREGCVETYLSGGAMAADHARVEGVVLDAPAIAEAADRGDAAASRTIERYCDRLARALSTVINILDPEVIVAAGGVSNIARIYERVPELWGRYVFSDTVATRLVRNVHGDASGVRGAAWLWPAS